MKKLTFIVLSFLSFYLLTSSGCTKAVDTSNLPFTSAIIKYMYTGARNGSETVYIDLKANKIAVEKSITTTFQGIVDKDETLDIYDGKVAYGIHLGRKQAIKMVRKGKIIPEMFGEKNYSGYYKEEDSFLGKICKVYQTPQATIYFWNGISLKEEMTVPLMNVEYRKEAISIELNTRIPGKKFKLPSGIKVTTTEKLIKEFKKKSKQLRK